MHLPRWIEIITGIPAVAIAVYLIVHHPKSLKEWLLGLVLFGYFLLYYWVLLK
jgi:hypothetical protein